MYNWQLPSWTKFKYNLKEIEPLLLVFIEKSGISKGLTNALSKKQKTQTIIDVLVTEAIKNSEIEGEFLSRKDVMSSIKNNLGLGKEKNIRDMNANGMANLVTEIHKNYELSLSENVLFDWHKMIFSSKTRILVGNWRQHNEPMQVVSGRIGKEIIHFEAPPSKRVPKEMASFIEWFNNTAVNSEHSILHAPVRSAIAHLYFESIHPFEDGNGRIGRAIAEKSLFQSINYPLLISLSTSIEANKLNYYNALKEAQQTNEITNWIIYFIGILIDSLDNSEKLIDFTLKKTRLFDFYQNDLNERQLKVIKRMLDAGPGGFEGGMTAKKYMRITKTSKATATRDIQKLKDFGVFSSTGGGRSTSYTIQFLDD
jgi:Fic family protein